MTERPVCETKNGRTVWYLLSNGKMHRLDGPAVIYFNGSREWIIDGKRHRIDGPAIEDRHGKDFWYINNKELDTKEIEAWIAKHNVDLHTKDGQMRFKLRWA